MSADEAEFWEIVIRYDGVVEITYPVYGVAWAEELICRGRESKSSYC